MAYKKLLYKNPEADLKIKYPKLKEVGLIIALGLLTILFFAFKDFTPPTHLEKLPNVVFKIQEIPPTTQYQKPPVPNTPIIPVSSLEPELPDPIDIWAGVENTNTIVVKPPVEEEIEVPFRELSEEPKLELQILPVYPEIARKAGITGKVFVEILIDTKGAVEEARVIKGHPMLNEAALEAVRQWQFSPAKQRERLVKVRMTFPVDFRLKD